MPAIRLQPWNIEISRVGPPALPPVEALASRPIRPEPTAHPRLPFDNLAFEGGGAKGIAYVGAVQVLEEEGLYPRHVRRVAGTSSGSFLAAMLAVGCPADELEHLLFETDLAAVMRDARFGLLSGLYNMVTLYGLNPGARLLDFLGDRLRERTGSEDVTFRQVLERCGRELCVPVTNLTRMCTEYCHPKTTPDMPVRLAVGMSMSLPVLMVPYRIQRQSGRLVEADLYTDGGLLCNFPVHAFDGWWLSLSRDDTFLARLRPRERAREKMHDTVRFAPRNPRTLGFTVFDRTEHGDVTQAWVDPDRVPIPRPDTLLAQARGLREERLAQRGRMAQALERAAERLVDAMAAAESDGDGRISRAEADRLFAGPLTPSDAELLFGTTDIDVIFRELDQNGDAFVTYDELVRFVDGRNVDLTAHLGLQRSEPKSMSGFVATVFNTLLMHLRKVTLHPEDRDRTVPIDTDYIGTSDFDLQPGDRTFLLEAGRQATRAFLRGRTR